MPNHMLEISEIIELSPTSKAIRINLNGNPFNFQPGQFVMLEMDLEKTEKFKVNNDKKPFQKRPFSISSIPDQDYLEVTVKTTEEPFMSDYLVNYLETGEKVAVTGPFGRFFLDENETKKNIMLIGAGSGIAPLLSIMRYIHEKNLDLNVHIIFSNKTEDEILWKDEMEKLCEKENLTFDFTLTRQEWSGTTGRVNKEMIQKNLKENTDFYLCGSPAFVKTLENILLEDLKIPKEDVHKEAY